MTSSISPPSPFEIPYIKNAKLVKLEKNNYYITLCTIILDHSHLKTNLILLKQFLLLENIWIPISSILDIDLQSPLECTGKPYLLKAQHSAFNISDSTTIRLTVQNWQITFFVPDSTDLVVDYSSKCLGVRTVGMQRCPRFHKNVSFAK